MSLFHWGKEGGVADMKRVVYSSGKQLRSWVPSEQERGKGSKMKDSSYAREVSGLMGRLLSTGKNFQVCGGGFFFGGGGGGFFGWGGGGFGRGGGGGGVF